MGSLTPEIRRRIVKAYKKGYKIKDIAAIFGVSRWGGMEMEEASIPSWKRQLQKPFTTTIENILKGNTRD